jgi:hypothetical protein
MKSLVHINVLSGLAALAASQLVSSTITDYSKLTATISAKYSAFTYCSNLLLTCQPTVRSCAQSLCASCTSIGQVAINSCCASEQDSLTACFSAVIATANPADYQTQPLPEPTFTSDAGFAACMNVSSYSSLCESLTPGFATETVFPFQAPCLCYTGEGDTVAWKPDIYDGWVSACNSHLSLTPAVTAPCRTAGDVVSRNSEYTRTATSASSSTTSTGTASTGNVVRPGYQVRCIFKQTNNGVRSRS